MIFHISESLCCTDWNNGRSIIRFHGNYQTEQLARPNRLCSAMFFHAVQRAPSPKAEMSGTKYHTSIRHALHVPAVCLLFHLTCFVSVSLCLWMLYNCYPPPVMGGPFVSKQREHNEWTGVDGTTARLSLHQGTFTLCQQIIPLCVTSWSPAHYIWALINLPVKFFWR